MKPDGIRGGGASYPGKARPVQPPMLLPVVENRLDEGIPKRGGAEGGRFTGSTDDSGPAKPGNSVEEKTLTIGKGETRRGHLSAASSIPNLAFPESSPGKGKPWTRGGSDRMKEPT